MAGQSSSTTTHVCVSCHCSVHKQLDKLPAPCVVAEPRGDRIGAQKCGGPGMHSPAPAVGLAQHKCPAPNVIWEQVLRQRNHLSSGIIDLFLKGSASRILRAVPARQAAGRAPLWTAPPPGSCARCSPSHTSCGADEHIREWVCSFMLSAADEQHVLPQQMLLIF